MEPSLSDFQVAWIMDLANKSEQLTAELSRLRKAIEEAIKHQEIVGGSLSKMSTTVRILRNALEGKE